MTLNPKSINQSVRLANEIAIHEKQIDSLLEEHAQGEEDLLFDKKTGAIEVWLDRDPSSEKVIQGLVQLYLDAGWESVDYVKKEIKGGIDWRLILTPPQLKQLSKKEVFITPKNPKRGFVYLFKCNGLYKIGRTKNPTKRMQQMASAAMPFEFERIHVIGCKNAIEAERELHKKFSSKRKIGEWFDLSEIDIEEIKSIVVM